MALAVVTVAAGGLPVVDNTAATNKLGRPVSEAANGRGIAVTKVASGGMPLHLDGGGGSTEAPRIAGLGFDRLGASPIAGSCGGATATTTGAQPSSARAARLDEKAVAASTPASIAPPSDAPPQPVRRCSRRALIAPPDRPAGRLPT